MGNQTGWVRLETRGAWKFVPVAVGEPVRARTLSIHLAMHSSHSARTLSLHLGPVLCPFSTHTQSASILEPSESSWVGSNLSFVP